MTPRLVSTPIRLEAAGEVPKVISEYIGRLADGNAEFSLARMRSPQGWSEPGQRPEFDEFTLVLDGAVLIEHEGGTIEVAAGQAAHTPAGTWVRYATPEGADYVAICRPAFSPTTVHRDAEHD